MANILSLIFANTKNFFSLSKIYKMDTGSASQMLGLRKRGVGLEIRLSLSND